MEGLLQLLLIVVSTWVCTIVGDDVVEDGEELLQLKMVAVGELLILDSGEDSVTEMVLLLHGTPLAGKGTVGLGQHKG